MQSPVVLELFTSQSCSSCPSADALLKRVSEKDPSIIALSYHVDYWDRLNWKDTYSSPENTQRQNSYAKALQSAKVFTPQLIVNGVGSMVGSNEREVMKGITEAKKTQNKLKVSIKPENNKLAFTIEPQIETPIEAEIWEVRYDAYTNVQVKSGENGGRTLESINNVTSIKHLANWNSQSPADPIMLENSIENEVIVILAQTHCHGTILGAASYDEYQNRSLNLTKKRL